MRRVYVDASGSLVAGNSALEVCEHLREQSLAQATDLPSWLREAASRVSLQTGAIIDPSSPEKFVAGLVKCGLLRENVLN
jgi:hypothetical protein